MFEIEREAGRQGWEEKKMVGGNKDGITRNAGPTFTREHDCVLDTLIVAGSFPLLEKVERVICV